MEEMYCNLSTDQSSSVLSEPSRTVREDGLQKERGKKEIAIDCLFTVDSISTLSSLVFKSFEFRGEKVREKKRERAMKREKGRQRQRKVGQTGKETKATGDKCQETDGDDGEKG